MKNMQYSTAWMWSLLHKMVASLYLWEKQTYPFFYDGKLHNTHQIDLKAHDLILHHILIRRVNAIWARGNNKSFVLEVISTFSFIFILINNDMSLKKHRGAQP